MWGKRMRRPSQDRETTRDFAKGIANFLQKESVKPYIKGTI
jgi:hypothetical protein